MGIPINLPVPIKNRKPDYTWHEKANTNSRRNFYALWGDDSKISMHVETVSFTPRGPNRNDKVIYTLRNTKAGYVRLYKIQSNRGSGFSRLFEVAGPHEVEVILRNHEKLLGYIEEFWNIKGSVELMKLMWPGLRLVDVSQLQFDRYSRMPLAFRRATHEEFVRTHWGSIDQDVFDDELKFAMRNNVKGLLAAMCLSKRATAHEIRAALLSTNWTDSTVPIFNFRSFGLDDAHVLDLILNGWPRSKRPDQILWLHVSEGKPLDYNPYHTGGTLSQGSTLLGASSVI